MRALIAGGCKRPLAGRGGRALRALITWAGKRPLAGRGGRALAGAGGCILAGRSARLSTGAFGRIVAGAALAGSISGAPSTVWALVSGDDPLAAARAAGTLLPGYRRRPNLAGGVLAHTLISTFWSATFVLAEGHRARVRRWSVGSGMVAGAAVALLDLEVIGRRFPAIAALPRGPQWLDHMAFGAVLGGYLGRRPSQPARGKAGYEPAMP